MSSELEWILRMRDGMSGEAKKAAAAVASINKEMAELQRLQKMAAYHKETDSTKKALLGLQMQKDAIQQQTGALKQSNDTAAGFPGFANAGADAVRLIAGAAISAAKAVAELGIHLAQSAIEASSLKRNTLSAFSVLTGSKDEAQALYGQISAIADVSPFETKDVGGMFRSLLGGGFDKKQVEETLKGVFDVGAIIGGDQGKEQAKSIIQQMLQVRSIGKLAYEDLKQISQASGGLIPIDKVAAQLAEVRKTTQAEAMKAISAGQITAVEGQAALLAVIQKTADHGGDLGTASKQFGMASLEGQLSTLKSRWAKLFEDVDIGPIIKVIDTINGIFNSDAGKRAKELFTGLFDKLFAYLGKLGEGDGLAAFINVALDAVEGAIPYFLSFWGAIEDGYHMVKNAFLTIAEYFEKAFGGKNSMLLDAIKNGFMFWAKAIGYAIVGLAVLGAGLLGMFALFEAGVALLMNVVSIFWDLGASIVQGIWGGITAGWGVLISNFTGLLDLLPASVKSVLGIHSPSALMADLFEEVPAGGVVGMERGTPKVKSAIDDMLAMPAAAGGAAGAAAGGSGAMHFGDIQFSFNSGPKDHAEAKEFGKTAAHEFRAELSRAFSSMAVEAGAGQ